MTQEWNPGHSLNKGYPYNRVESLHAFPSRIHFFQRKEEDGNHAAIDIDREKFPNFKGESVEELKDFLFDRGYELQEALKMAEGQVHDLLEEHPFMPENYGFELVHRNRTPKDPPVRIYVSKYDDHFSIYRKPGDDLSTWILIRKIDDDTTNFSELELKLPCARIAYAALWALGVKMEEKKEEVTPLPQ